MSLNPTIRLFSRPLQFIWALLVSLSIAAQVCPMPPVAPWTLYIYVTLKCVLLVLTGAIAPLAFWKFDRLTYAILFALLGTTVAEALQSVVEGHRASFEELILKLLLLLIGFILGLAGRDAAQPVRHTPRPTTDQSASYLSQAA